MDGLRYQFLSSPRFAGDQHRATARSPVSYTHLFGITIALYPLWPHITDYPAAGTMVMWLIVEAALGIGIGLAVSFVTEAFLVGAQAMSLQAGYAFASTFYPNTQADSGVIVVLMQIVAGLLFFTTGLDREVIRIFARSMAVSYTHLQLHQRPTADSG